jgi:hypothetical protein
VDELDHIRPIRIAKPGRLVNSLSTIGAALGLTTYCKMGTFFASNASHSAKGLFDILGVECPNQDPMEGVLKVKPNRQVAGCSPDYEIWVNQYDGPLSIAGDTLIELGNSAQ